MGAGAAGRTRRRRAAKRNAGGHATGGTHSHTRGGPGRPVWPHCPGNQRVLQLRHIGGIRSGFCGFAPLGNTRQGQRQRRSAGLHRACRLHAPAERNYGEFGSACFLYRVFQGRLRRFGAASGVFPRRRSRRVRCVAGVRRPRPQAHEMGGGRHRGFGALPMDGQSEHAARASRPGLRQSGRHGV